MEWLLNLELVCQVEWEVKFRTQLSQPKSDPVKNERLLWETIWRKGKEFEEWAWREAKEDHQRNQHHSLRSQGDM